MKKNKIKLFACVLFTVINAGCKENNKIDIPRSIPSNIKSSNDYFIKANNRQFIGHPVKEFLDSLACQKGIPQKVEASGFLEPLAEQVYFVNYSNKDSTLIVCITGKKTSKQYLKERKDSSVYIPEIDVPLYEFQKDTISKISVDIYNTSVWNNSEIRIKNTRYRIKREVIIDSLKEAWHKK